MEDLTFAVPTLFGLEGLCADEMRRFLPAGLMTSTVESPRWSAWAIEQIGTLYGTPGTPSSADAVPGFPIFGASNDSSPTR